MATLNHDGVELYYEVHGDGPVILLSHGYSATSQMWRGQVEALSKTHKLVIWDMRGHGQSDYPDDPDAYSEPATVADMAAILDAVGADKAIVGGLSLGGYMSLAFNRAHPDRVRALLIIDTGPGYRNDEAREGWKRQRPAHRRPLPDRGLGRLASGSPEMRMSHHRNAEGLAKGRARHADPARPGGAELADHDRGPSLVLVGADDTPFLAASDYMAAKIPGAVKVVIPNAGHAANIDQPEAFNRAVVGFLEAAGFDRPSSPTERRSRADPGQGRMASGPQIELTGRVRNFPGKHALSV